MVESRDLTISHRDLKTILEIENISNDVFEPYLNGNDEDINRYKKSNKPVLKVSMFRLSEEDCCSQEIDAAVIGSEILARYKLEMIQEKYLWDLSPLDKVDLITCGRFKNNDLVPEIKCDPLKLDLGVSREHSVICVYNKHIYYIDYGTAIKSESETEPAKHFGSKNGSWVYSGYDLLQNIKNESLLWKKEYNIGIGSFFYNMSIGEHLVKAYHQFILSYEWVIES